jgi:hypothetical protein
MLLMSVTAQQPQVPLQHVMDALVTMHDLFIYLFIYLHWMPLGPG